MSERRESVLTAVCVAAMVALFLAWCGYLQVPLVDDAAISIAYGRSLFSGYGFRLTQHSQVVEAFSNPTWTVLLGLSVPLGLNPITFATRLGYLFAALSLPAVAAWGPISERRGLRFEDALAAAVPLTVTAYGYWACGGLETGVLSFLLALSGALWLRERRDGRTFWSALTLGLVCLTRPEGALYAAVAGVLMALSRPKPFARPSRQEVLWTLTLAAIVGAWLAFRWNTFGAWVANTYYAKRDGDFYPQQYLAGFARENRASVLAAALAWPLVLAARRSGLPRATLALGFVAAGVGFIVRFRADWMPEWRFVAPLVPCAAALVAAGVAAVRARAGGWLALALSVVMLGVAGERAVVRSRGLRGQQEVSFRGVYKDARVLGGYLRALGMRRPLLGLPDIGGLAFAIPEAEVMDTAMLADWSLARHIRSRPMMDDYLRFEGPPSHIDAHGPSGFLNELPRMMAQYVPLESVAPELHLNPGNYILRGLTATDDPRCPGGKSSVLALSADALAASMERTMNTEGPVAALRLWRCAWTYQPDERLPTTAWREAFALRAERASVTLAARGELEPAVRYSSLATVLRGQLGPDRRRTEALRERLFSTTRR